MSTVSAYCELSVTAYDRSGTDAGRERTKQRRLYFKVAKNGLLNLNRRERKRNRTVRVGGWSREERKILHELND